MGAASFVMTSVAVAISANRDFEVPHADKTNTNKNTIQRQPLGEKGRVHMPLRTLDTWSRDKKPPKQTTRKAAMMPALEPAKPMESAKIKVNAQEARDSNPLPQACPNPKKATAACKLRYVGCTSPEKWA